MATPTSTQKELISVVNKLTQEVARLADAVESASVVRQQDGLSLSCLDQSTAYVWDGDILALNPVHHVDVLPFELLKGIESQRERLLRNTLQFARGHSANNVLLWGVRGTGKSTCVRSVWSEVCAEHSLLLVEVRKEDIKTITPLLTLLRRSEKRTILFCDDLSFDEGDNDYKYLKVILEGGIEGRPSNVLFYATSNRRHIIQRFASENSSELFAREGVEEKVSLSDRFGLWIGFHSIDKQTYQEIIVSYAEYFSIVLEREQLLRLAHEWAVSRGARSGRVAWQFIQDIKGRVDSG